MLFIEAIKKLKIFILYFLFFTYIDLLVYGNSTFSEANIKSAKENLSLKNKILDTNEDININNAEENIQKEISKRDNISELKLLGKKVLRINSNSHADSEGNEPIVSNKHISLPASASGNDKDSVSNSQNTQGNSSVKACLELFNNCNNPQHENANQKENKGSNSTITIKKLEDLPNHSHCLNDKDNDDNSNKDDKNNLFQTNKLVLEAENEQNKSLTANNFSIKNYKVKNYLNDFNFDNSSEYYEDILNYNFGALSPLGIFKKGSIDEQTIVTSNINNTLTEHNTQTYCSIFNNKKIDEEDNLYKINQDSDRHRSNQEIINLSASNKNKEKNNTANIIYDKPNKDYRIVNNLKSLDMHPSSTKHDTNTVKSIDDCITVSTQITKEKTIKTENSEKYSDSKSNQLITGLHYLNPGGYNIQLMRQSPAFGVFNKNIKNPIINNNLPQDKSQSSPIAYSGNSRIGKLHNSSAASLSAAAAHNAVDVNSNVNSISQINRNIEGHGKVKAPPPPIISNIVEKQTNEKNYYSSDNKEWARIRLTGAKNDAESKTFSNIKSNNNLSDMVAKAESEPKNKIKIIESLNSNKQPNTLNYNNNIYNNEEICIGGISQINSVKSINKSKSTSNKNYDSASEKEFPKCNTNNNISYKSKSNSSVNVAKDNNKHEKTNGTKDNNNKFFADMVINNVPFDFNSGETYNNLMATAKFFNLDT